MHRPQLRPRVFSPGRRGGRVLVVCAAAVAVVVAGYLAVRDSSLVRVQRVYITGLVSPDEPRIRRALRDAALDMTTLRVDEERLLAAVRSYPSITGIDADADLPNELSITVRERRAVATLDTPGARVPVAADGALLSGMRPDPALPTVKATHGSGDARVSRAVTALASAPGGMLRRAARAYNDGRGLVVDMRAGPSLVFGDAERARAKWLAAARVLAEPSAAGAVYLDVRVPERVAAGGVARTDLTLESSLSNLASPLAQVQAD
jgi:cell division protein FtsQ